MRNPRFISNYFTLARFLSDCLLIPFIIVIAYSLKFKVGWLFQNIFSISYGSIYQHAQVEPYLQGTGLIMMLWITTFYLMGLYRPFVGIMSEIDEFVQIFKGVTLVMFEVMAVIFVYQAIPGSRFVIFYTWVVGIIVLSISRYLVHLFERKLL